MQTSEAVSEIAHYTLIPYSLVHSYSSLEAVNENEWGSIRNRPLYPHSLFRTLVHLKEWMKTSEAVSEIAQYTLIPYSIH